MGSLIMVADDTPEIVSLLKDVLTARGHQVVSVTDGVQMVEKAKDWRPHLIVADIMMPGTYGTAAHKTLLSDPQTAKIPVIFLTAVHPDKAKKIVQENSRTRVVYKPVDVAQLMRHVDELLALPPSPPKP